jgi:hypothetical protein
MKPEELFSRVEDLRLEDRELMLKKNHDYAGGDDALSNFRAFGFYGVVVRLHDKFSRVVNLVRNNKKASVAEETIKDTLRDIRNYATIAEIMWDEENDSTKTPHKL